MYHSWLDRWDERRARRGEEGKKTTDFILDAERAFPGASEDGSIEEFCLSLRTRPWLIQPFSMSRLGAIKVLKREDGWLKFPSDISTDVDENNVVWAKITESGSFDQAMVVFHHWNASARNRQIANFFSQAWHHGCRDCYALSLRAQPSRVRARRLYA
jgi:hypothetical protein